MRFAFIVNNYPPKSGGVENHVFALATRLVGQGHDVRVYALDREVGVSNEAGIEVHRLRETPQVGGVLGIPFVGTSRYVRRSLRERPADIISVHTRFFPMTVLGSKIGRRLGIPVIHTEHGSDHVASSSPLVATVSKWVDLTLGRASLRRADAVLGVSEDVVAFVNRLAGVKARVFYNAIELQPQTERVVQRPNHFVFVGRVAPGKGWEAALAAVEGLHAAGAPVTAEFLGDGPELEQLRDAATLSPAREAITVRGRVPASQVRDSLRGATLVNPTVLSEGFQTTLLEALAEGGRVATYPVPGAALLRRQGAPVVVTEARSQSALLDTLRGMAGAAWEPFGQDLLEQWSWSARTEGYLEIANELGGRANAG